MIQRTLLSIFLLAWTMTLVGCGSLSSPEFEVVRVPEQADTITEAVEMVKPGGLVLVDPGTYPEQVLVNKEDVTIRGLDRNATIVDGDGKRPYGIAVVADGVTVENLTVTRTTFYGLLFTGLFTDGEPGARTGTGYVDIDPNEHPPLQRFLADHVTATNNGLYGVYAFNAQHGVIRDSYASGSADSGVYVGQCSECNIVVQGNIAENNAVGFENANASDSVWIVENDFSNNRIGMLFMSNYQEAYAPQRTNWVGWNRVEDNNSDASPAHAAGTWGVGIGLSGAGENEFEHNLISEHVTAGVMFANAEDLPTIGNSFSANLFERNTVDVLNTSSGRAPASGNCFTESVSTSPASLLEECAAQQPTAEEFLAPVAPPGVSFLKVALPPAQDQKPMVVERPGEIPATLPSNIHKPDSSELRTPRPEGTGDAS